MDAGVTTRRLDWAGFHNARDLGGLPVEPAGATRFRALVRSDLPGALSTADPRALAGYGIRTIVDLRASREVAETPSPLAGVPGYVHVSLVEDPETWRALAGDADMGDFYLWLAAERADRIAEVLRSIAAAPPGAVLFHCLAGKDRTGIVAALLLDLAGVARGAIVDDYLLSDGAVPMQYRPIPEYLHRFLDHLDERHGGVAAFLAASGVPAGAQTALRARLVDP
jgi:protein tyrosine/serine phosphatase